MDENESLLAVASSDQEALSLCLALGTLQAIRSGAWPVEAGIWTIARPVFRSPLESLDIPDEVLKVFQHADELSALLELAGREAVDRKIDEWIAVLQARLASLPEQCWYAKWQAE